MNRQNRQANIEKLLEDYEKRKSANKGKGELLSFAIDGKFFNGQKITVYNPTKPIFNNGKRFILGRVEPKDSERSKVMFFVEQQDGWRAFPHPIFDLQDPFYRTVQGWQILGGVEIDDNLRYRTVFYRYKNCATELLDQAGKLVAPFATGPWGMKDIRLIDRRNGKIGVFTRPQGGEAGLGKIAYIEIDDLDELEEAISCAKIIDGLFGEKEWGGANELHYIDKDRIGVLGHIAHYDGPLRHYYAMSFIFDTKNKEISEQKILTTADEFPSVESKKTYLGNIVFSGGLVHKDNGLAELYCGIGDTCAGQIQIVDPFAQ